MSDLRVVFMGTPDFAVPCLETLINGGYNVVAVVTQPDRRRGRGQKVTFSPIKECANAHEIPVIQPEKVRNQEFIAELKDLKPDVIIVVAFGQLLPSEILNMPPRGCINVHASILPKYRGAAPIHWSIINGEAATGVTTMFMDIGMDTGDMILKKEVAITDDETTGQLHDRLKELGAVVLSDTMKLVNENQVIRIKQDNSQATYAPLLTRELEKIDWTKSAVSIHNLVRGLNPWPGAYCLYQERILKIWKTRVCDSSEIVNVPGRIQRVTKDSIIVETGKGTIEIIEVQPECKRRMSAKECACGYCLSVGDILG